MGSVIILTYDKQTVVKTENSDNFIYKNFSSSSSEYIGNTIDYPYIKTVTGNMTYYVVNPGNKTEQDVYNDFSGSERTRFAWISLNRDCYRGSDNTYLNNAFYFETILKNTSKGEVYGRKISGQPEQIVHQNYCVNGKPIAAYGPEDLSIKLYSNTNDYSNTEKKDQEHLDEEYRYKYFGFRKQGLVGVGSYISTFDALADMDVPDQDGEYILIHCGSPLYSYQISRTSGLSVSLSCTNPSKISAYILKYKAGPHISPGQEGYGTKTNLDNLASDLTITTSTVSFTSVAEGSANGNDVSGTISVPVLANYPDPVGKTLSVSETNIDMYFFTRGKLSNLTRPDSNGNAIYFENLNSSNYNDHTARDKGLGYNDYNGTYIQRPSYDLSTFAYSTSGTFHYSMYGKNYLLKNGSKSLPITFKALDPYSILDSHPRSYGEEKILTTVRSANPADIHQITYLTPVFSNRTSMPDEDRYLSPFMGYNVNESYANYPQPIVCVQSADIATKNLLSSGATLESHTQVPSFTELKNKSTNIAGWYYGSNDDFYFVSLNTNDRNVEEDFVSSIGDDFNAIDDKKGFVYLFKPQPLIGD